MDLKKKVQTTDSLSESVDNCTLKFREKHQQNNNISDETARKSVNA